MQAEARLKQYRPYSVVVCSECDSSHNLGDLLHRSTCDTANGAGRPCESETFDGYHLEELAEVATQ